MKAEEEEQIQISEKVVFSFSSSTVVSFLCDMWYFLITDNACNINWLDFTNYRESWLLTIFL